ncbi:MAG: hypothetical protein H0U68_15135, partial [Ramlibacter sp.]|nr:hypothetical protein [Ramlibacter sp.]
ACPWLLVAHDARASLVAMGAPHWKLVAAIRRPTDSNEDMLLYRRVQPAASAAQKR